MEPQTKRLEYKVGLFIGVGLLAVMAAILLLGGDRSLFTRYIEISSRFNDVQGLFPGSVVSLAGVPVGNIKEITFVPSENKLQVTMKVDRKYSARLVEGTIAEIRTQGALGDKYIYLDPGQPQGKRLKNGALIEANDTDFMKMLTDRNDGAGRIIDLIKELHILVSTMNSSGHMGQTMQNVAEASLQMKTTLKELGGLVKDLRGEIPENNKLKKALVSLSSTLEKIDQGKGTLGQLVNDPSLHQSLKAFLGGSPRNNYMKGMIRETIQKADSK